MHEVKIFNKHGKLKKIISADAIKKQSWKEFNRKGQKRTSTSKLHGKNKELARLRSIELMEGECDEMV